MTKGFTYKAIHALFRNNYMINGSNAKRNCVNLEYWQREKNIGDCLAPIIYKWMLSKQQIDINTNTKHTIHLLTVGSILSEGFFPADATVWGTGIHHLCSVAKLVKYSKFRRLDIRAVRGPVTANILKYCGYSVPDVFGDPGVLMPQIYKPSVKKEYECSLIRHFASADQSCDIEIHKIDTRTTDYKLFIDEICKSRLIISSSLHGIILAESYGVPAIFLQEGMDEEILKYYDWYYSTNRKNIVFAYSVDDALNKQAMPLPQIDILQNNLINSFPYDIWRN